jgi:alpha-tubulin suppressor-like RCC1 family protein
LKHFLAALALCALVCSGSLPAQAAARFAVVAGNNQGAAGRAKLWFAEKDAERVGRALGELGDFPEGHVTVLKGGGVAALKAAVAGTEAQLKAARAAGERTLLVVYYSGHAGDHGPAAARPRRGRRRLGLQAQRRGHGAADGVAGAGRALRLVTMRALSAQPAARARGLCALAALLSATLATACAGSLVDQDTPLGESCSAPLLRCPTGCCAATAVAAGGSSTCALAGDAVRCWGANDLGQRGAAGGDSSTPMQVAGLASGATQVVVGGAHACALVSGEVWCWGSNGQGQLGAAASSGARTPAVVAGLGSVTGLAAGGAFTCARTASSVLCWGQDDVGQLGDGGGAARSTPTAIAGVTSPRALAAGGRHACALGAEGLVCWGADESGQAGNGKFATSALPGVTEQANQSPSFVGLGGDHGCVGFGSGALSCFGLDSSSQLGDRGTQSRNQPTRVLSASALGVAAGRARTCARLSGGGLRCWGANDSGKLGLGDTAPRDAPADLSLAGVQDLALGSDHSCALLDGGGLRCWGKNDRGQLGAGSALPQSSAPLAVSGH